MFKRLLFIFLLNLSPTLAQRPPDTLNSPLEQIVSTESFEALIQQINSSFGPKEPETTRFYVVRHAESFGNRERLLAGQTLDVDLTPEGVQDAIKRGKKWQREGLLFDVVFSSPMLRTRKTAQLLLEQLDQKPLLIFEDDRLIEKHSGKFEGKKMDQTYLEAKRKSEQEIDTLNLWGKLIYKLDQEDDKEETILQVFSRTTEFILSQHEEPKTRGKTILVTSHSAVLKSLFIVHAGVYNRRDIASHRFFAPNCSLLIMDVVAGMAKIVYVEDFKFNK